ncbi:unnamed protein product [Rotaria sp. Silwood2]|nr:unnamed protein product [Rotaria sp. Silwood2]CAF2809995.1 unnamed protein product [Rotaria sp. Silwood2]CAF3869005.1 unnamed protein product [Rotaria sp. Silwood2]CAF4047490.1 unnamed protein product [Rotaria sp. Silwood2]
MINLIEYQVVVFIKLWFNDICFDRQRCASITVKDTFNDRFAENVANELSKQRYLKPFVIFNKWRRKKFDFT